MGLRFGIVAGQARPFAEILDDWLFIERLGFDNAWLIDHFSPDFRPNAPLLESWTTLAGLAARTSRIRIGTAVTNAAVRNPGVLCKEAITVDQISDGRLEMAVGAGYYESEHRMLGIDYLDPRGRSERLREVVQVLDAGLRGDTVALKGVHWQLDQLPMGPGPVQRPRPPIWVAAQGRFSLQTAALHADVLVTMGGPGDRPTTTLTKLRERFDRLEEHCRELSRDAAGIRRAYLVGWAEDGAFDSEQAWVDFVGSFAAIGVTDFIIGLGSVGGRAKLERLAASLPGLSATVS